MIRVQEITQKLQQERSKSMAHDAVYHVLALRRRSRRIITLRGLIHRMKREGFNNFNASDYAPVLEGIGNLGLGKVQRDARGKVTAVYDIRTTLDSIGKVACGQTTTIRSFKHKNRYRDMPEVIRAPSLLPTPPGAIPIKGKIADLIQLPEKAKTPETVSLMVGFMGNMITINIPRAMDAKDLVLLLAKIQNK